MNIAIILNAPEISSEITEDNVIFADAGYRFNERVKNKNVLAVVGDFDSLEYAPTGQNVVKLDVEKNFTDGEVAVRLAKEKGGEKIVLYGAFGGKFDHMLGNVALLKIAKNIGLTASIKEQDCKAFLITEKTTLTCCKGGRVSVIPYGGECSFNSSSGLYYPLNGLTLTSADTRGLGNIATDNVVEIDVKEGEALVVIYEK